MRAGSGIPPLPSTKAMNMKTGRSLSDLAAETWKVINGWPYEVSSLGRIRRTLSRTSGKAGKILQQAPRRHGYLGLTLCSNGKRRDGLTANLVCTAFHGSRPSQKHQVAHLNGINDDNTATNLAWKIPGKNELDKRSHARAPGSTAPSRLREIDIKAILALLMTDRFTKLEIAAMFDVTDGQISHIEFGRCWPNVDRTNFQPLRIKRRKPIQAMGGPIDARASNSLGLA